VNAKNAQNLQLQDDARRRTENGSARKVRGDLLHAARDKLQ
jgi:hypothetical protein